MLNRLFIFCLLVAFSQALIAETHWSNQNELKYIGTYYDLNNAPAYQPHDLNLRLILKAERGTWSAVTHYQLNYLYEPNGLLQTSVRTDQARLFNLSYKMIDQTDKQIEQRLDRLFVQYQGEQLTVKLGRQALTWGNAFYFQIMDFFNPFSPVAWNREYKTGDDMFYADYLFNNGDDLQMVVSPKRNLQNNISDKASSAGAKYHTRLNNADIDLLAARHLGEYVGGFSLGQPIKESMWRMDLLLRRDTLGKIHASVVSNLDYSWTVHEHNVYGFVEVFHNGDKQRSLQGVILSSTNYVGTGLQIELHPLVKLNPSVLASVDDKSALLFLTVDYNMTQNFVVNAGVLLPLGASNSEFNGTDTSGKVANLIMNYYF